MVFHATAYAGNPVNARREKDAARRRCLQLAAHKPRARAAVLRTGRQFLREGLDEKGRGGALVQGMLVSSVISPI